MRTHTITLVKPSDLRLDTRLIKEIGSITKRGYDVNVVSMYKRNNNKIKCASIEGYQIFNLELNPRRGFKSLLTWPLWWLYEFYCLLIVKSDLFHVINYNSVLPALIVGRVRKIPVIYEMLDTTYETIHLPKYLRSLLLRLDKLLMSWSDAVILVDEKQVEEFGDIPNPNVNVIYDTALDFAHDPSVENVGIDVFLVVYVGTLSKSRNLNLDKLSQIVRKLEGIKFIIAGYGDLVEDIKKWETGSKGKIEYIGPLDYSEALKLSLKASCLVVLRDSNITTNKFICGSKIWEAMMCSKPILVNNGTSTADKVLKENCGIIVDVNDLPDLEKKIALLKNNPELCRRLGQNGRRAYEEKYSWNIMEERLFKVYLQLICNSDRHNFDHTKCRRS